jgi:SAM-dependent methyltransferase
MELMGNRHPRQDFFDWGVAPGSRVLDAGCGTGRFAPSFEKSGWIWVGCDEDFDALSTGVEVNPISSGNGVHLTANLSAMPWRNSQFGGIIACDVLHFATSIDVWLQWMEALWSSLIPGGIFWGRMRLTIETEFQKEMSPQNPFHSKHNQDQDWILVTPEYLRQWAKANQALWLRPLEKFQQPQNRTNCHFQGDSSLTFDSWHWVWRKPL